jgi:hypothetical protein
MTVVVEDELVSLDELQDQIAEFEDYVQVNYLSFSFLRLDLLLTRSSNSLPMSLPWPRSKLPYLVFHCLQISTPLLSKLFPLTHSPFLSSTSSVSVHSPRRSGSILECSRHLA